MNWVINFLLNYLNELNLGDLGSHNCNKNFNDKPKSQIKLFYLLTMIKKKLNITFDIFFNFGT